MKNFRAKPTGWQHDNYRHYLAAKFGSAGGKKYYTMNWRKWTPEGKSERYDYYKFGAKENEPLRQEEVLRSLRIVPASQYHVRGEKKATGLVVEKQVGKGKDDVVYGYIPLKPAKTVGKENTVVKGKQGTLEPMGDLEQEYGMYEQEAARRNINAWKKRWPDWKPSYSDEEPSRSSKSSKKSEDSTAKAASRVLKSSGKAAIKAMKGDLKL